MKVCILTTSFPLGKGDISGMFVLEQARHLIKHGAAVCVVAPHHDGVVHHEDMNGIEVHRFRYFLPEKLQKLCYGSGIPNNIREFPWTKLQLPLLVFLFTIHALRYARSCDIIHAHWSIAGIAGFIAARILGKPIVLNIHHGSVRDVTKIEKILLETVDYVVFNSSYTMSHAMKYTTPPAFAVVSPGVDTDKFQRRPSTKAQTDILPPDVTGKPILFTLGRLVECKGHKYLIEAMRLVNKKFNAHLLVGGDGPQRQDLDHLVSNKDLENEVTFLGHIPWRRTNFYYTSADIYLQPSIIDKDGVTEGLGVTILEAMACGTPCIGSKVGGIPDLIRDGINGFLVNPAQPEQLAEKINILLGDKELREKMGAEGRRFVEENYSWNAKAGELMGIYGELLKKRNK